jgi:hypothetical protein
MLRLHPNQYGAAISANDQFLAPSDFVYHLEFQYFMAVRTITAVFRYEPDDVVVFSSL